MLLKLAVIFCLSLPLVIAGLKPNIVMIVADDLGWDDVSFHGSAQIPTPNIDNLANNGVILNSYYVTPICTPSRSAIMTGKYPIHTGMQTGVIRPSNAWGVDPNEKFLPQYLKMQGYKTHAVGKWHLGMCSEDYLPNNRGFDSFYGYYMGKGDYWDHSDQGHHELFWGLDLHENGKPIRNQWGNYSTDMYTAIGIDRIKKHNKSDPLFLYLAYQAVHSANRKNHDPIQAQDYWLQKFNHIKNEGRRKFAAVTASLDYGVGMIVKAIEDAGILDNTIIVFTTDNGGPANGFDFNYASNFPLRGIKAHLWEGGVRGVAFVYSKLLKNPGRVSNDLFHITDWLPTFFELAGGNSSVIEKLDGFNIWDTISNEKASPRKEILLNIDPLYFLNAAVRVGDYKLVQGESGYWSGWFPPPESEDDGEKQMLPHNKDAVITCGKIPENVTKGCSLEHGPCLFDIKNDPCEYFDIGKEKPEILKALLLKLKKYTESMVVPRINITVDPLADPKLHGGSWEPWLKKQDNRHDNNVG